MPSIIDPTNPASRRALRKQQQRDRSAQPNSDTTSDDEHWSGGEEEEDQEPQPIDIDESWNYTFQAGDQVWIRTTGGNWLLGQVTGQKTKSGKTREKEGIFYPVIFDGKLRKWFSPLNGDIKPDNRHIRSLLAQGGWL